MKRRRKVQHHPPVKSISLKHSSIRQDGTPSIYYKHYAFQGRMRRFANKWFFELTPTFHFTEDGRIPHPNADVLLSGIKRMERHPAVLGAFLTWKELLTENTLFNFKYRFLTVLAPEALVIDRGIDDRAWRPLVATDEDVLAAIDDAPESTDSSVGLNDPSRMPAVGSQQRGRVSTAVAARSGISFPPFQVSPSSNIVHRSSIQSRAFSVKTFARIPGFSSMGLQHVGRVKSMEVVWTRHICRFH